MKTKYFKSLILLFCLFLFCTVTTATSPELNFGVYKLIDKHVVNSQVIDSLESLTIVIEKNAESPILAYVSKESKDLFPMAFEKKGFCLLTSEYAVDKEKKYYTVIVVELSTCIDNSDLKKTKAKGSNIELYFNMKGSKRWETITNDNIEEPIALTINQKIYSLPTIKAKINNGIAVINGLEESQAKSLSEALNESL